MLLVVTTANQVTSLINKEMIKELLALAYINPDLTLDEDNPETGKPYKFMDYCIISSDSMTPDRIIRANEKFDVTNVDTLERVTYLNSDIYDVVKDYTELLKSMGDEVVGWFGRKQSFEKWCEEIKMALSQKNMSNFKLFFKYLADILIDDSVICEVFGISEDELDEEVEKYQSVYQSVEISINGPFTEVKE